MNCKEAKWRKELRKEQTRYKSKQSWSTRIEKGAVRKWSRREKKKETSGKIF